MVNIWIPQIRVGGRTRSDVTAASREQPPMLLELPPGGPSQGPAPCQPQPRLPAACTTTSWSRSKAGTAPRSCQGPWGSPRLPDECQWVSVLTGVPQGSNPEGTVACQGRANGPKQNRFLETVPRCGPGSGLPFSTRGGGVEVGAGSLLQVVHLHQLFPLGV